MFGAATGFHVRGGLPRAMPGRKKLRLLWFPRSGALCWFPRSGVPCSAYVYYVHHEPTSQRPPRASRSLATTATTSQHLNGHHEPAARWQPRPPRASCSLATTATTSQLLVGNHGHHEPTSQRPPRPPRANISTATTSQLLVGNHGHHEPAARWQTMPKHRQTVETAARSHRGWQFHGSRESSLVALSLQRNRAYRPVANPFSRRQ